MEGWGQGVIFNLLDVLSHGAARYINSILVIGRDHYG